MRPPIRFSILGTFFITAAAAAVAAPALAQPCSRDFRMPLGYSINPVRPCAGDDVVLTVYACGPCVDLISPVEPWAYPHLKVRARMDLDRCLVRQCQAETLSVDVGQLTEGRYAVQVEVLGEVVRGDSTICAVAQHDTVRFGVTGCSLPGLPPYVFDIVVGQRVVCITTPCPDLACPNDSIPVSVRGAFPHDCFSVRRVELVRTRTLGPPRLRILLDDGGCLGRPCSAGPVPWSARVFLPPLPPGDYRLPVEVAVVTCSDTFPNDSLVHRVSTEFRVVPECPRPVSCVRPSWSFVDRVASCDAVVFPGHHGRVALRLAPTVALAGVQGDLVFGGPGLRIASLAPMGFAQGMRLQWRATDRGARFVLFAERGAPIPYYPFDDLGGWPTLLVTVEQPQGVPLPERSRLIVENLIASDSNGARVAECNPNPRDVPAAIICSGSRCDRNADGASDVRDLVLMVHCVLGNGPCPAIPVADLDCDGNGRVELEDVLCCARFVIDGGMPDSGASRPEPSVRLSMRTVRPWAAGFELPIVLEGADRIGAARLVLSYPADRFDVASVELAGRPDWLSLYQVRDGKIVVGLIATPAGEAPRTDLEMTLRLVLKPGQTLGGEVWAVDGQFSGPDGIGLDVELGRPGRGLDVGTLLSLSPSRPNPFAAATRFTVDLGVDGELGVGVYDLTGRRVRGLFRGPATAGTRELDWDGRRGDGSLAPSGVYFLRADAGGRFVWRKVMLLRDR